MINYSSEQLQIPLSCISENKSTHEVSADCPQVKGKSVRAEHRMRGVDENIQKFPITLNITNKPRQAPAEMQKKAKTTRETTTEANSKIAKDSRELKFKPGTKKKKESTRPTKNNTKSEKKTSSARKLLTNSMNKPRDHNSPEVKENEQITELNKKKPHENNLKTRKDNSNRTKKEKIQTRDKRKIERSQEYKLKEENIEIRNKKTKEKNRIMSERKDRIGTNKPIKSKSPLELKKNSSPKSSKAGNLSPFGSPKIPSKKQSGIRKFIKNKEKAKRKKELEEAIFKEAKEIKRIISLKQLNEKHRKPKANHKKENKNSHSKHFARINLQKSEIDELFTSSYSEILEISPNTPPNEEAPCFLSSAPLLWVQPDEEPQLPAVFTIDELGKEFVEEVIRMLLAELTPSDFSKSCLKSENEVIDHIFSCSKIDQIKHSIQIPLERNPISSLQTLRESILLSSEAIECPPILNCCLLESLDNYENLPTILKESKYNKMVFDVVDEILQNFRPFGLKGKPLPWNFQKLRFVHERKIMGKDILCLVKEEVKRLCEVKVGGDEETREENMCFILASELIENDEVWVNCDNEEAQITIELADEFFQMLVEETVESIH